MKWGVAGSGRISHDFVTSVQASICSADHEFIAIGARTLESAQKFASLHGIPTSYGSYEDLAKDPYIQVVYVGTINSQHFPICKLMLENKKHVLVEKSMAVDLQQTKDLIDIARKNQRFLMEALWSRCLPSYQCLMKLIDKNCIGEVLHVEASLGLVLEDALSRKRCLGESSMLALGIYPLNAVSIIYGGEKPEAVAAVGHMNEDGVDISVSCSLRFSKNRTAQITTSMLSNLSGDLVITGTEGTIRVPERMWCAPKIETPSETYYFPLASSPSYNFPDSGGLFYEAMEVKKCIEKGALESSLMPLKDSEALAEIMEEIRRQVEDCEIED